MMRPGDQVPTHRRALGLPGHAPGPPRQMASGGGMKSATAWWYARIQRATCTRVSSAWTQAGRGLRVPMVSPVRKVRTSRPCSSSPRGRGAPVNPWSAKWTSNACTAGVHGPAVRRTVCPARTAPSAYPPSSRSSPGSSRGFTTTLPCLSDGESGVDFELEAGDVAGFVGDEEEYCVADVEGVDQLYGQRVGVGGGEVGAVAGEQRAQAGHHTGQDAGGVDGVD